METSLGLEADDPKRTPRVLRALPSPRERLMDRGQGRKNHTQKVLSGSRGGQSSWAYVNMANEKDVHLILSPETLKRRKEERMARVERLKDETGDRKDDRGGKKSRELRRTESAGKTVDAGARGEGRREDVMKTFGLSWDSRGVQIRDRSWDKSRSASIKRTYETSSSWPLSTEESSEEKQAEGLPMRAVVRGYGNLAEDANDEVGFRLKHLTREWERTSWRRARKGSWSSRASGTSGGSGVRDIEDEDLSPRDSEVDVNSTLDRRPSLRVPVLPFSSHFTSTTRLLLSHEREEFEVADDELEGDATASPHRSYSAAAQSEDTKDGLHEEQISFMDNGKKRSFKVFSAK